MIENHSHASCTDQTKGGVGSFTMKVSDLSRCFALLGVTCTVSFMTSVPTVVRVSRTAKSKEARKFSSAEASRGLR